MCQLQRNYLRQQHHHDRNMRSISTGPKGQKKDSFKAEATGQLTFVTKSNALRKAAKEKTLQLQEIEDKLNGKLEALKGC